MAERSVVPHSGSKWLKPAKNKFTWCDLTSFWKQFSAYWHNFRFRSFHLLPIKICQIVYIKVIFLSSNKFLPRDVGDVPWNWKAVRVALKALHLTISLHIRYIFFSFSDRKRKKAGLDPRIFEPNSCMTEYLWFMNKVMQTDKHSTYAICSIYSKA